MAKPAGATVLGEKPKPPSNFKLALALQVLVAGGIFVAGVIPCCLTFSVSSLLTAAQCSLVAAGIPVRTSLGDQECVRGRAPTRWEMPVTVYLPDLAMTTNVTVYEPCEEDFAQTWNVSAAAGMFHTCVYRDSDSSVKVSLLEDSLLASGEVPTVPAPVLSYVSLAMLIVLTLPWLCYSLYSCLMPNKCKPFLARFALLMGFMGGGIAAAMGWSQFTTEYSWAA